LSWVGDREARRAVAILRQAGRVVARAAHSSVWTVGLATYDRRQLIAAAHRVQVEGRVMAEAECRDWTIEQVLGERRA
jgi:uncharacterized iron-regulated membrane protein